MPFGAILFVTGYVIFYWGTKHFTNCRYSLVCLFGFTALSKSFTLPPVMAGRSPGTSGSSGNLCGGKPLPPGTICVNGQPMDQRVSEA
jgi:hypothetical protein